ncbi:NADH-quinone oxidoreductase subunit C [uncultured Thermanaerothrix sp.]|uniref:NADH-quinone oxidoreductase subunit C n=1 Tax=uncultured Thermanaerothrix sp. TaxID=1195149 RepID=UPI00260890FD|nr:NADH-quinone oxidoreductase subunit C [uncultured Thermanaerothrix sp.]
MSQEAVQEDLLNRALEAIRSWVQVEKTPQPNRVDVVIRREDLLTVVETLKQIQWGYLSAITGMDHPAVELGQEGSAQEGYVEVLYHFCEKDKVLTLRVSVPYSDAVIPSICGILPSATLYERELSEMFGVQIEGTPDTNRLLLPDNWPEGVYPLRKAFTGLEEAKEGSNE